MHKTIEPKTHGIIDYLAVALLLLAPTLFNFSGVAASLSYIIGIAYFAVSVLTKYPLSLAKVIPFKTHGIIELSAGVFMIIAPFLFGFTEQRNAMWYFIISGIGIGIFYALSDYRSLPATNEPMLGRRRSTV